MISFYIIYGFMSLFLTQPFHSDTENVAGLYVENKYFEDIKYQLEKELDKYNIHSQNISNRNEDSDGFNILLIPNFIFVNDLVNEQISIYIDSINPINRAILFRRDKYLGTLLCTASDTFYCSRKICPLTNFDCGKYVYSVSKYPKSLKVLLKKDPIFVLKTQSIDRVWFFIDSNQEINVFTYNSEQYSLNSFYENDIYQDYLMPEFTFP